MGRGRGQPTVGVVGKKMAIGELGCRTRNVWGKDWRQCRRYAFPTILMKFMCGSRLWRLRSAVTTCVTRTNAWRQANSAAATRGFAAGATS